MTATHSRDGGDGGAGHRPAGPLCGALALDLDGAFERGWSTTQTRTKLHGTQLQQNTA